MSAEDLVKIRTETDEKYVKIEFELTENIIPAQIQEVLRVFPDVKGPKHLLISGRGPIWLYGALIHKYAHLVQSVAIYDPKQGGYVVVVSHSPEVKVGDLILA